MFGMVVGILFGLYVITTLINLVGVVIGAVFSGISFLISEVFSLTNAAFTSDGLAAGIVFGIILFCWLKKRNAAAQHEA